MRLGQVRRRAQPPEEKDGPAPVRNPPPRVARARRSARHAEKSDNAANRRLPAFPKAGRMVAEASAASAAIGRAQSLKALQTTFTTRSAPNSSSTSRNGPTPSSGRLCRPAHNGPARLIVTTCGRTVAHGNRAGLEQRLGTQTFQRLNVALECGRSSPKAYRTARSVAMPAQGRSLTRGVNDGQESH